LNVLAICHDIEPLETPQAIQISRHLAHLRDCGILLVSGGRPEGGPAKGIDGMLHHLRVPGPATGSRALQRIARLALPVYAKAPDGLGPWKAAVLGQLGSWLAGLTVKPDVIATFGEPMSDHLIGLDIKRRTGLPWLAHFSDPWSDNPFRRGGFLTRHLNAGLERSVIEAADIVVFTSDETAELVGRRYDSHQRGKFRVVGHGFDASLFPKSTRGHGKLLLSHIGSFYGNRTPFPLVQALQRLATTQPDLASQVRVELIGSMPGRMARKLEGASLPPGLLTAVGPVSYRESLARMARSDLLLLIDAPARKSVFLASKLIDYIGADKPVFAITPPGTAERVVSSLGGVSARPEDPDAIASALAAAIAQSLVRRGSAEVATTYDPMLRQSFAAQNVADQLRSCLAQTLDQSGR
jgi:glycosyltransferase involved in cell wall biosynthesis